MVFSNGNGLWVPRSEIGGPVGGCNGPDTHSSRSVELQYTFSGPSMSIVALLCRFFAQTEWPVLLSISARISDIDETSLHTHNCQSVYGEERKGILAIGRCPGPIGCLL